MNPDAIVFGFDRQTDERSLLMFLALFTDTALLELLLPRLQDEEILAIVDFLTRILRKHLSEKEYHAVFLSESTD